MSGDRNWRAYRGGLGRATAFALLAMLAWACQDDRPVPLRVRLEGPVASLPSSPPTEARALRMVFSSVLSPEKGTTAQHRFGRLLAERLGQPVEVVSRRTYAEANELLRTGGAQLGLVCTGAYALGRESFGLRLVAVPVAEGKTTYQAFLIARQGSAYRGLDDVRGKPFAFSDPLSNTGYRYVAELLHDRGINPDQFFGRTVFTYSHDNTLRALREGIAEAGTVDSLVWHQALAENPELDSELVVFQESPHFPINPIVTSPHAPPDLASRVRQVLLALDPRNDPAAQEALQALGISGFAAGNDPAYDEIAQSWRELGVLPSLPLEAR